LAATVQRREELERIADDAAEDEDGPEFIRPIALIQAQSSSSTRETHTVDKVKAALIERLEVPAEYIRICTGTIDEIGDTNLMETTCPVRYVITVDKLREGWDCPLAYVLGSIGNAATPTAVEQLIGRVLRMPFATPTRMPALDRAYAFVLSDDVVQTAIKLRDRMVESCGFDARSAEDALRVAAVAPQRMLGLGQIPLSAPPPPGALSPALAQRSRYDENSHTLVLGNLPNLREIEVLRDSLSDPVDRAAVEAFWQRERPVGAVAKNPGDYARPLRVPRLTVRQDGRRTLLEPEELDTFSWNLAGCTVELTEGEFSSDLRVGSGAIIDLQEQALIAAPAGDVRLRQLELIGEGEDWEANELVRWLDHELHRGDSFRGLPLAESQPWLRRTVDWLVADRSMELPMIVRRRHQLAEVLRTKVADQGRRQVRDAMSRLIHDDPGLIETSDEHALSVEELSYCPLDLQEGHRFRTHAFTLVARMNREELQCATRIDGHPNVRRWIRNTDRATQGGFFLPLSPGKFFPDFIVELNDGALLLVEYKMGKMSRDRAELHKKDIGELWAARSGGRARFAWVVEKDWAALEQRLAG
jgi:type III restriction enzyme